MTRHDATHCSLLCGGRAVGCGTDCVGDRVLPVLCVYPGGQHAQVVFPWQWVALFVHQLDVCARQFVALPLGPVGVCLYAPIPTQRDGQVGAAYPFGVAAQGSCCAAALMGRGIAGFGVNS